MRSFIKAHKKSTSFDESPKRHSHFSTNTNNSSQRSSDDFLDFLPSTPSQMSHDNVTPTTAKHSPGFESFHRLANKTSKLFKKTSNSNLNSHLASNSTTNLNPTTSNSFTLQNPPVKNAAPQPPLQPPLLPTSSTSSFSQHDNDVESIAVLKKVSPIRDLNKTTGSLPAIKGTITHSWGDPSKIEPHVIILNDPASPASNTSDATSFKQFKHSLLANETATSSSSSSNLEPPIRILNKNKPDNGGEHENDDDTDDGFPRKEQHIYKSLAQAKNRNRQARIHSHDDIIHLGKTSQMDMSLLAAAFSGYSAATVNNDQSSNEQTDEKILDIQRVTTTSTLTSSETTSLINKSPSFYNQPLTLSPKIRHDDFLSSPSKVNKNQNQNETSKSNKKKVRINLDNKERKSIYSLKNNSDEHPLDEDGLSKAFEVTDSNEETPEEEEEEEEDDDDDDDDDNESEFSFEYAGINVRTSSVKYYSKPEPAANVYIDDLYEDENFDDDMNCIEDDESDIDGKETDHLSTGFEETTLNNGRVKKYNDLFDLTDDDEDDDYEDQEKSENERENGDGLSDNEYDSSMNEETVDDNELLTRNKIIKKPIQKYNDLFDLSDEDEEEYGSEIDSQIMFSDGASGIDSAPVSNGKPTATLYSQLNKNITAPEIKSDNKGELKNISKKNNEHISIIKPSSKSNTASPKVKSFSDIFNIDDSASDDDSEIDYETRPSNFDDSVSNDFKTQSSLETALHENDLEPCSSNHSNPQLPQTPARIQITPSGFAMCSQNRATIDDDDDDDDVGGDTSSILRTPFQLIEPTHLNPTPRESSQYLVPFNTPPLPPPARSQSLKFHDLNCDLDSEVPRPMSNLFFIDEAEEDEYNQKVKVSDYDNYDIDEINGIPEDFNFSDSEIDDPNRSTMKSPLRRGSRNRDTSPFSSVSSSFRSTHSFNGKLTIHQGAKELAPMKNKIELTDKTVTFFNNSNNWNTYDNNSLSRKSSSQLKDNKYQMHTFNQALEPSTVRSQQPGNLNELDENDDDIYIISPNMPNSVTPSNSFNKPTPDFSNDYSLSPIQETPSSVHSSPRRV
ncbi:zrg8p [Saccharomyces arboricola H-6]|uniref:Zrg8p n=1 Tax=Saccharomyces arboricola (strain H-6 / AS 2.3317 / CBS 10644) TaxID=1160507 RepID=J8LPK0_SACAR|nr:zrg8p [Saccharomyces arboricola H-6]